MALDLPNIAPASPWSDVVDVKNHLTDKALEQQKQKLFNKYYGPNIESEIAQRQALTKGQDIANQFAPERLQTQNALAQENLAQLKKTNPLAYEQLKIQTQFLPREKQAQLTKELAQAEYYKQGGPGMGVANKSQMAYQSLVAKDNPQLNQNQIYEAANVLAQGGDTLSDGTKLNPLSPSARQALNVMTKYGTTSPLITQNIRGTQAEAEIGVLSKYAQEGLRPYGDTFFGYSPSQIKDSFKSDSASQERLGKFIAAKQLQYEIAQNEIKLAQGQPGVTSTQELMDLGMQNIKSSYPKLSAKARETAQNYFIEALKEANKARQNVDIGAASASTFGKKQINFKYNPQTGLLEAV